MTSAASALIPRRHGGALSARCTAPTNCLRRGRLTSGKGTFGGFGAGTPDITFEGDAEIEDGTGIKEVEIVNSKLSNCKSLGPRHFTEAFDAVIAAVKWRHHQRGTHQSERTTHPDTQIRNE